MKSNQQRPKLPGLNLYSKFNKWCKRHHIPTIILPITLLAVVGFVAFVIGGTVIGLDFLAFITSPTGWLAGFVLIAVIVSVIYFKFIRPRWL